MKKICNYAPWILGLIPLTLSASTMNENAWIFTMIYYIVLIVINLIPKVVDLIKLIKEAKKDGKIDSEEIDDILNKTKEIVEETKEDIENIKK